MERVQTLRTKDSESSLLKQTLSPLAFLSLWLSGRNRTHTVTLDILAVEQLLETMQVRFLETKHATPDENPWNKPKDSGVR
jgi:hypothetical protein